MKFDCLMNTRKYNYIFARAVLYIVLYSFVKLSQKYRKKRRCSERIIMIRDKMRARRSTIDVWDRVSRLPSGGVNSLFIICMGIGEEKSTNRDGAKSYCRIGSSRKKARGRKLKKNLLHREAQRHDAALYTDRYVYRREERDNIQWLCCSVLICEGVLLSRNVDCISRRVHSNNLV